MIIKIRKNFESGISELKELFNKSTIETNIYSEDKEISVLYRILQNC